MHRIEDALKILGAKAPTRCNRMKRHVHRGPIPLERTRVDMAANYPSKPRPKPLLTEQFLNEISDGIHEQFKEDAAARAAESNIELGIVAQNLVDETHTRGRNLTIAAIVCWTIALIIGMRAPFALQSLSCAVLGVIVGVVGVFAAFNLWLARQAALALQTTDEVHNE